MWTSPSYYLVVFVLKLGKCLSLGLIIDQTSFRFTLTNSVNQLYQTALTERNRFGTFLHSAAAALRLSGAEDHTDATLQIAKAIDVYLLEYGITRSTYLSSAKAYQAKRE